MRFQRPTIVEIVVLAFGAVTLTWFAIDSYQWEKAERRGARDAAADLRRGIVVYRLRGKAMPYDRNLVQLASERFGVRVIRTGGCMCSGADCSYDYAYNRVVEEYLASQFGVNPIQRMFDESHEIWETDFEQAHSGT